MPSRKSAFNRAVERLLTSLLVVFLGGFFAATLVRFSPGYGVDERELDSRLNSDSIRAIRQSQSKRSLPAFYAAFLRDAMHGEFGVSRTFDQPISHLLDLRWKVSAQSMAYALLLSWLVVLVAVGGVAIMQSAAADLSSSALAGALLALPTAMVALFAGSGGNRASLALIIALAPALFRYTRNIIQRNQKQMYVVFARAQGIGASRLLFRHILPNSAPHLIGLAGVSVSLAIGALIPIEFLCDSPGLGQLALQAALARDLPLLVVLTVVVTLLTLIANLFADLMAATVSPASA